VIDFPLNKNEIPLNNKEDVTTSILKLFSNGRLFIETDTQEYIIHTENKLKNACYKLYFRGLSKHENDNKRGARNV